MPQGHLVISQSQNRTEENMEPLDVVFMIDATGSMASTIQAAHQRAVLLARGLRDQFGNSLDVSFATICYRDPDEDGIPSEYCWFNRDAEQLQRFFGQVQAKGGGDTPEDWSAAIELLFSLNWRSDSMKCVIWIADAPSHGLRYTGPNCDDNHRDKEQLLEPLVIRMAQSRVVFFGLDLCRAEPTFREIQKIYTRNGGVSLTYEKFQLTGQDDVGRIGAMLHQKTVMLVEQTVMYGNANAGQSLRRSGSVLNMKPPASAISAAAPVLTGIFVSLQNEYTNFTHFSGQGGCAAIYAATRQSNYTRVAIKRMMLTDSEARKYFNREVEALQQFSNLPGCLPYISSLVVGNEAVIITPLMANRDLATALKMEATGDQTCSEWATTKSKIAYRVIATLRGIHSRGYVHRDIKPLNIFLNENYEAVIGDWGLARPLGSCSVSGMQVNPTMALGTAAFMAPELFSEGDTYDQSVDIFAWSIVVYAMLARGSELTTLFDDGVVPRSQEQLMMKIQRGTRYRYLGDISSPWWTLISQCWSQSPTSRPTAAQICTQIASYPGAYLFPGGNEQQFGAYIRAIG
jgi:hypothetical protein